jgi:hypothetical protein
MVTGMGISDSNNGRCMQGSELGKGKRYRGVFPNHVEPRDAAKTPLPRSELSLNGIPGGGARREGSDMIKFENGLLKTESISTWKRP